MWTNLTYRTRMSITLVMAFVVHLFMIFAVAEYTHTRDIGVSAHRDEPIVLDLQQEQRPRQFIDAGVPTEAPVDPDTDLISEVNSKASDMNDGEGDSLTPDVGNLDDADEFRGEPEMIPSAPEPPAEEVHATEPEPTDESGGAEDDAGMLEAVGTPKPDPVEAPPAEEAQPERMEVAKLPEPATPAPVQEPGNLRSRSEGGGVESLGFLGFEAMQDEFSPYLKVVRDRVERRWKAVIQGRYSGNEQTRAVLDCSIAPDGKVVKVEVVDPGDSATYAALCKSAIEQTSPFPPFPFKVPAMYKRNTLDIRWTFSYL